MHEAPESWQRHFRHYVLLRPQEVPCPQEVLDSMHRHKGTVTEVHNPIAALSELCTLNRFLEPRRRQAPPDSPEIALLIFNPDGRIELLPDLYRAVRERLRDVVLFAVESTPKGPMLLDITKHARSPRRAPDSEPGPETQYGHLKLTGAIDDLPPEEDGDQAGPAQNEQNPDRSNLEDPAERTLSAGELDMLLGRNEYDAPADDELE